MWWVRHRTILTPIRCSCHAGNMNEWVGERPSFWILSGQSLFSVSNPNQIDPAENNEYIDGSSAVSIHTSLQGDAPPVLLVDMYVYIYRELLWYNYGYVYHAFDPSATLQYTNLKLTRGHRLTQEIINSVNSDGIKWLSPKSNSFKVPRGAVVSACGNSGQWQHALALLSEMQQDGIQGQRRLASPGWRSHWTTWMWSETAPPNTK